MPWSKLRSLFDGGRPKKANVSETPDEDPRGGDGGDGDDEEEDEWVEKTFERDVTPYEITLHWIDGDDETVLSYGIDEETEECTKTTTTMSEDTPNVQAALYKHELELRALEHTIDDDMKEEYDDMMARLEELRKAATPNGFYGQKYLED